MTSGMAGAVESAELAPAPPGRGSQGRGVWRRFNQIPSAQVAAAVVAGLILIALASYLNISLGPYSFDQTSAAVLANPSSTHWMGTDELGRDTLARIIYGSRLSISIGLVTALVSLVVGTIYGAIAGYCSGAIDSTMMRAVDVIYALPDLLVMILVGVFVGHGTFGILVALGLISWMGTARLVRAQLMQLKQEEFVEAARAMGLSPTFIVIRHLLPNAMGPIIVSLTFIVPSAILAESTLSFIGLGLSPPACSWGTLASDGWRAIRAHPHLIIFPSLFIFAATLSFNFLGDGLRDALDPRTKMRLKRMKKGGIQ